MNAIAQSDTSRTTWQSGLAADTALRELIGHSIKLPSIPGLYDQVITELESPRGSMDLVARLVARDPAISARILQIVNSAAFAPAQPITSPHDAVLFLGAECIKAVILFGEILAPLKNTVCRGFSLSDLWRHSVSVGTMALQIARMEKASTEIREASFTAGLLHDVGKILFVGNMPVRYGVVVERARLQNITLKDAEEQVFGINHADLGALLLTSWGLPQTLIDTVGWHHEPCLSGDRAFSLLSAVHIANALDHELHDAPLASAALNLDYLDAIGVQHRCEHWRAAFDIDPLNRAGDSLSPVSNCLAAVA